jgi:hypothetical protein
MTIDGWIWYHLSKIQQENHQALKANHQKMKHKSKLTKFFFFLKKKNSIPYMAVTPSLDLFDTPLFQTKLIKKNCQKHIQNPSEKS